MDEVMADNVSLSPNLISYRTPFNTSDQDSSSTGTRTLTEIVSFSFTIGTTPMDNSSFSVFTALRYRVRCITARQHTMYRPQNSTNTHVGNITSSQQNLSYRLFQMPKKLIIQRNKTALPNRCQRLDAKERISVH